MNSKHLRLWNGFTVTTHRTQGAIGWFFQSNGMTRLIMLAGRAWNKPSFARSIDGSGATAIVFGWFSICWM